MMEGVGTEGRQAGFQDISDIKLLEFSDQLDAREEGHRWSPGDGPGLCDVGWMGTDAVNGDCYRNEM